MVQPLWHFHMVLLGIIWLRLKIRITILRQSYLREGIYPREVSLMQDKDHNAHVNDVKFTVGSVQSQSRTESSESESNAINEQI